MNAFILGWLGFLNFFLSSIFVKLLGYVVARWAGLGWAGLGYAD